MRSFMVTPVSSPNLGTGDSFLWVLPEATGVRTLHRIVAYTNAPFGLRMTLRPKGRDTDFLLVDVQRADLLGVPGGAADNQRTVYLCGGRHERFIDDDGEEVSRCGPIPLAHLEPGDRCEVTVTRVFGVGPIQFAVGGEML